MGRISFFLNMAVKYFHRNTSISQIASGRDPRVVVKHCACHTGAHSSSTAFQNICFAVEHALAPMAKACSTADQRPGRKFSIVCLESNLAQLSIIWGGILNQFNIAK